MLSDELLASLSVPAHERMWTAILGGTDAPGAHVAERADGTLVGFVLACTPHEDDAPRDVELGMLYLLDEAKGSGLADLLVEAALGDRPAFLWTADLNHRALAFYARHGFRRDGASKRIERWDDILDVRLVR
ncbi:GNAT family N-acetyltransferase [Sanguibacter sp. HDW7]|nr:GNAT family N-acetyltransferase [Sanguibacter sp. HDW7]